METTNLSRIEQAVAFVNEVRSINKRFEGTSVSVTAKCELDEKGEISISSFIWAANQIIRSILIFNLQKDENYTKFLSWKEKCEALLAKSAEEIESACYGQKIAELKAKLNQYGKEVFHHCLWRY